MRDDNCGRIAGSTRHVDEFLEFSRDCGLTWGLSLQRSLMVTPLVLYVRTSVDASLVLLFPCPLFPMELLFA